MKRIKVPTSLALVLVFAVGCGATTKSTIPYHEEAMRGTDDAIVYIFRQEDLVGSVGPFNVHVDGKIVGALKQSAYMPVHVLPGIHSVQIGEPCSPEEFKTRAGETYYILSKGAYMSFLSKDQALPILQTMKYDMGN